MTNLQRKYVDLIFNTCSKWPNWDPPIEVRVGSYGRLNKETGDLDVEGNIYDPSFQEKLDQLGINLKIAEYPPEEGPIEDNFIVASSGVKKGDLKLGPDVDLPGLASATLKGEWQFENGKRDALLVLHAPRQLHIPKRMVLRHLWKVREIAHSHLVTSAFTCPAYYMYLSGRNGEKISLALAVQAPVVATFGGTAGGDAGMTWWADAQAGMIRKACNKDGQYSFTPLYSLRKCSPGFLKRLFREEDIREPESDEWLCDLIQTWDPLDEDGEEDGVDTDGVEDTMF